MLEIKNKIYLLLLSSFVLLFLSLAYSVNNISQNSEIISEIENKYFKLSKNVHKLNLNIEQKQASVLQSILLGNKPKKNHAHFAGVIDTVSDIIRDDNKLENKLSAKLLILKKRLISYKSVEYSIIESLDSEYK